MTQFSQQFLKVVQKGSKAVAEGSADIIINRTKEMHVSDSQKIVPHHRFRHCFQSHHPSLAECAHGHEAQSVLLLGHPATSADYTHKIRLTLQWYKVLMRKQVSLFNGRTIRLWWACILKICPPPITWCSHTSESHLHYRSWQLGQQGMCIQTWIVKVKEEAL